MHGGAPYAGAPRSRRNSLSTRPVWERRVTRATRAGEPLATIRPPPSPPSGPRSMMWSASATTSRFVLDHHHRVAGVDEAVQDLDEARDVGHVEPDGRLVEHVEGVVPFRPGGASAHALPAADARRLRGPGLGELGDELDALRLAAAERRTRLAEGEVAEPDVLQEAQRVVNAAVRGEELHRFVHVHREDAGDALPAEGDRQRLGIEAGSPAGVAGDPHVGEEAHRDPPHSLALARVAAPSAHVEGEASRPVSADAALGGLGEEAPDVIPHPHVGGGTGAGRLADRRLVHLEHPGYVLPSRQPPAAPQRRKDGRRGAGARPGGGRGSRAGPRAPGCSSRCRSLR